MYLQEVVISPDIFEKIGKAFSLENDEDIDLKSYKENLNLKKILFDLDEDGESILSQRIQEIIDSSTDFGKRKIESVLKKFEISGKKEFRNILTSKYFDNNKLQNQVLNLCLLSESKIINSENKKLILLKLNHSELEDIEVLTFEEFIKPSFNSKVYAFEKEINIPTGEKFEFEEYFKPYLCEAENIEINDRYLRSKRGFNILIRLLNLCKKMKSIEIYTICRDNPKDDFDFTKLEFEDRLKKTFKNVIVTINHANNKIGKKRFLRSDDLEIIFDPGIDFIEANSIAEKNPVTITFKKRIKG